MQQILNKLNFQKSQDKNIEIYSNERIKEFEKEDKLSKKLFKKLKIINLPKKSARSIL